MSIQGVTPNRTGFAVTALVTGIVGLSLSWIPIIGVVAWPLSIIAIVFGVLGRKSTSRGKALAGLVTGIVALFICILWVAAFSKAANDTSNDLKAYDTCTSQINYNDANYNAEFNHCLTLLDN